MRRLSGLNKLMLPICLYTSFTGCQSVATSPVGESSGTAPLAVTWSEPPQALLAQAGRYAGYVVANPSRVDRYLGAVSLEESPNHWLNDQVHLLGHADTIVLTRRHLDGRRISRSKFFLDGAGRVRAIDGWQGTTKNIFYHYLGSMPTPILATETDRSTVPGEIRSKFYFRDRYGNFMGVESEQGVWRVERASAHYEKKNASHLIHLALNDSDVPLIGYHNDDTPKRIGWSFDLASSPCYSVPSEVNVDGVDQVALTYTFSLAPAISLDPFRFSGQVSSLAYSSESGTVVKEAWHLEDGRLTSHTLRGDEAKYSEVYSDYVFDERDNWTSRKVTVHESGKAAASYVEHRRITY